MTRPRSTVLAVLVALAAVACTPGGKPAFIPTTTMQVSDLGLSLPLVAGPPAGLPADDPHAPVPGPGTCHLGHRAGQPTPDHGCTPGAINPAVTQATIGQTICVSGWTKTVRPSTSMTGPLKRRLAVAYAIPPTGELDHLVSLELGGAPDDPRNLWVEPGGIPNPKDRVENWLKRQVCAGRMTLAEAQAGIADDWTQYLGAAGGAPASQEN